MYSFFNSSDELQKLQIVLENIINDMETENKDLETREPLLETMAVNHYFSNNDLFTPNEENIRGKLKNSNNYSSRLEYFGDLKIINQKFKQRNTALVNAIYGIEYRRKYPWQFIK